MWVILPNNAGWDCFKILTSKEILKIRNPLLEEHCAFLEVIHLFPQKGCARNKLPFRTVQQNLKIISGRWIEIRRAACSGVIESICFCLRVFWKLMNLQDCVWENHYQIIGSVTQTSDRTGRPVDVERSQTSQGKINVLKNVGCVPSKVQFSYQEALLYVFEDNGSVIKMIIKGRSPTMRHVSRTHRVALDWLFDRINLDPKIQIKYIDTKNQLADILTKGNFTRDEWNHVVFVQCQPFQFHSVL